MEFYTIYIFCMISFFAGFFLLIGIMIDYPNEIETLTELIPCKELKENAVFLKTHLSKDYIKEECF